MPSFATTAKERLAKAVGFDTEDRDSDVPSISNADPYLEREPTVAEFLEEIRPSLHDIGMYFYNLFPFLHWIGKYNLTWFIGDLIAGELQRSRRKKKPCDIPIRIVSNSAL